MKRFILFICLLLTSCAQTTSINYSGVNNYNSYNYIEQDSTDFEIINSEEPELSTIQEESKDPYNITTERIMLDVATAVYADALPDNPYSEPDFDGIISFNYAIEWATPTPVDDSSALGISLLEFQRVKNFPEYLFIHQPPMSYIVDGIEIMGMFMVTSNCLHMLCVYDYFVGDQIYIEFEAGPYAAFI